MNRKSHEIDRSTRLRIAANLREMKHKYGFDTDAAFAERLGVSRGVVNRALKGERTVGLDFLLAVHRAFPDVSIDELCDREPEARWYDPRPAPPASPAAAVGNEVEAARKRRGIPVGTNEDGLWKRAGLASRTHWYKKVSGASPFRWEEIEKIGRELGAPVRGGWPLVPWDRALAFAQSLETTDNEA